MGLSKSIYSTPHHSTSSSKRISVFERKAKRTPTGFHYPEIVNIIKGIILLILFSLMKGINTKTLDYLHLVYNTKTFSPAVDYLIGAIRICIGNSFKMVTFLLDVSPLLVTWEGRTGL